ncbi:ArsR/SmtB family transcription factor [Actinokineospora sp.]|uniref:ArsR/SmtB family transcription factor n=1 Tax=Actinokineospora sp. TaxID=1872133 RepID=UPI004037833E
MSGNQLATIGSLLADETRSELLLTLMDGRAHTGGELARHLRVSASTASEHLHKLLDAGMVTVRAQGRHRYFQLADSRIAELLELLGATAIPAPPPRPKVPTSLAYARTCYDHLAGELAVRIYDRLLRNGHLTEDDHHVRLTSTGGALLSGIGVDTTALDTPHRPTARRCLDWTERRGHLAGSAGAALLHALVDNRWVARGPSPRSVRVTRAGRAAIPDTFDVGPL